MNGIKYIREKSNFTKNALAERMGVTRQTLTMWESGVRKPSEKHLKWLSEFYGLPEKWFGELSDDELAELNDMYMFNHKEGDKEFFSFSDYGNEIGLWSFRCGDVETMLDEKYAQVIKENKELIKRVEEYLAYHYYKDLCLMDKITVRQRGMQDINEYLDLMDTVHGLGKEKYYLKVPFRYEIKTALYAMMVASGQYTTDEVKSKYERFFEQGYFSHIDLKYFDELVSVMKAHWNGVKNQESGKIEHVRKKKK